MANDKTVATKPENPLIKMNEQIEIRSTQFANALPAHIPVERFKRVLLTAVQNNPDLIDADRQTLFNSAMRAAQDGLLPDGREGALVIYNTKMKDKIANREYWIQAVQWMPMIAGIRKKVRNSGEIATWDVHVVREKDDFQWELGDEPMIKHRPYLAGDGGKVIAAYSVARMKSGEKSYEVMGVHEIEKVRLLSKNKDKGPWKDHYAEMCRKTVARRHSKVLPMSTDLDDLIRRDEELYDMEGASDKAQMPSDRRPQLADFVDHPFDAPMVNDPKAEKPAKTAADEIPKELLPDAEKDEPAGEPEPSEYLPEFSHADAHDMGIKARDAGVSLFKVPTDLSPDYQETWKAGWRERDEEIASATKQERG